MTVNQDSENSKVLTIIYLAQDIEDAFQEKEKVLANFLDLTKAFDNVWKESRETRTTGSTTSWPEDMQESS